MPLHCFSLNSSFEIPENNFDESDLIRLIQTIPLLTRHKVINWPGLHRTKDFPDTQDFQFWNLDGSRQNRMLIILCQV